MILTLTCLDHLDEQVGIRFLDAVFSEGAKLRILHLPLHAVSATGCAASARHGCCGRGKLLAEREAPRGPPRSTHRARRGARALLSYRVIWGQVARRRRAATAPAPSHSAPCRAVRWLEIGHLARQWARGRKGRARARRACGGQVESKDPDRRMCCASPPAAPHVPCQPAVVPPSRHSRFLLPRPDQNFQSPHTKGFVELALFYSWRGVACGHRARRRPRWDPTRGQTTRSCCEAGGYPQRSLRVPGAKSLTALDRTMGDAGFFFELLLQDQPLVTLLVAGQAAQGVEFLHGATGLTRIFDFLLIQPALLLCEQWARFHSPADARARLDVQELAALRAWTATPLCYALTSVLRSPERTRESVQPMLPFARLLFEALRKLPEKYVFKPSEGEDGILYRQCLTRLIPDGNLYQDRDEFWPVKKGGVLFALCRHGKVLYWLACNHTVRAPCLGRART